MSPERWQRINSVFESAMQCAPEDRQTWLAAHTQGDSGLRRDVEKMLRHAGGVGLLDTPAWEGLRAEMPLPAGARLGPHEIIDEIGAGGMGRVYKARDTRLGRIVAIKVLSAEFSDRLRFEARAISALSHPHVCALYDIGDQDAAAYLVMEFLEGESLAAHVRRGPLPLEAVLRYGAEIAGALAAAHAQGIVHRDLKPANVMITASGAKVLDFGVARIAHEDESLAGALIGTAAYMSPSQLNGNPAEARSDIYALGLVLLEMATGGRRSAKVPALLAPLIGRCLREDSGRRVQRMEEVQAELEQLRFEAGRPIRRRRLKPALAAMIPLIVVLSFAARHLAIHRWARALERAPAPSIPMAWPAESTSFTPRPPIALAARKPAPPRSLPAPSLLGLTDYPGQQRDPALSPDGSKLAFSWHTTASFQIWVRPVMREASPLQLTASEAEDWGPSWSSDGRKIAFRRKSKQWGIYWIDASGGLPNLISSIAPQNEQTLPQMSWSHDGKWIAAPDRDAYGATRLYLFSVASRDRRPLTINTAGTAHSPAFSPDGKSLAYASCVAGASLCDIYVIDLDRNLSPRRERKITDLNVYLRGLAWLPDGHSLVYSASRNRAFDDNTCLYRVRVDPPGVPERINLAGTRARHPAVAGGRLAFTRLGVWHLFMIENFR